MPELGALDIFLSILISLLILSIPIFFFKVKNSNSYERYLTPFVVSKIIFAIIFVLIHVYYYKGGDTFLYFRGGNFFSDQFAESPINGFAILFQDRLNFSDFVYTSNYSYAIISSKDVFLMSKIIGVLNILTLNQYMACSIVFTLLTAIGIWKLYVTFCKLYPSLYKILAFGILFYPSLGIWGSGILKDPLTLCCVGLLFWSTYNIIQQSKYLISIFLIALGSYFCYVLKPYILYTFIPIMFLWTQSGFTSKVKNPFLKTLYTPILLVVFLFGSYFSINTVSEGAGKYSIENVQSVAEGFHSWHSYLAERDNQSGYSLGEIEFTLPGILSKTPEGFFVTYYRPFLFGDVRNIATLFEGIQTFIFLLLTIFIFFRVGPFNFFKIALFDKDVRTFLLFAITFGVAVGITSYNFGALSRYKIPSLPFYVASLCIIYFKGYLNKAQKKMKTL